MHDGTDLVVQLNILTFYVDTTENRTSKVVPSVSKPRTGHPSRNDREALFQISPPQHDFICKRTNSEAPSAKRYINSKMANLLTVKRAGAALQRHRTFAGVCNMVKICLSNDVFYTR